MFGKRTTGPATGRCQTSDFRPLETGFSYDGRSQSTKISFLHGSCLLKTSQLLALPFLVDIREASITLWKSPKYSP